MVSLDFLLQLIHLSAIKYAKVKTIRDENGLVVNYEIEGDYPKYGNNDERVDEIAVNLVKEIMNKVRKHKTYRECSSNSICFNYHIKRCLWEENRRNS